MRKIVGQQEFKVISSEVDEDFVGKVKELLASDYPFDNIGKLCDRQKMATMSSYEREQYIFKIMDQYHNVLNNFDLVG